MPILAESTSENLLSQRVPSLLPADEIAVLAEFKQKNKALHGKIRRGRD